MNAFLSKLKIIFTDQVLRRRLLFVVAILGLSRLGSAVPIPGVDTERIGSLLADNQFLGFLNIFSGGGLSNLSIMMLGVGPFITASIIMQLLTMMFPALKQMYHEEGEIGRKKIAQYSRLLTVPLAAFQSYGLLFLLEQQGVIQTLPFGDKLSNIIVIIAGSVLLMWLGELISEYGIGNGVSLLIFAGIVARLPAEVGQLWANFDPQSLPWYLAFVLIAVAVVAAVVVVTEAERPIPVTYAKRVRGMKVYGGISTYLPIRVNNAGVMPIIFALSILLFPQMVGQFLSSFGGVIGYLADLLVNLVANSWFYGVVYFMLVFVFTYFYSAVTFDPKSMSENLQKNGAFIPGVRPGQSTAVFVERVLTRLTFVGASFLGFIALLPIILRGATGNSAFAIGGTSLLIVVSVVLDLVKQIDAQLSMREY